MVTLVDVPPAFAVKLADVPPNGTVTLPGTTSWLELDFRYTGKPPTGAGPSSLTVIVRLPPR
jgi:hypothetical protein